MGPDGIYRVVRPDAFVLDRFVPGMKTMAMKRHINNQQKKEQVVTEQFLANEASFIGEHSDGVITEASNHQLIYSLAGLGLGLACVVGGIVLSLAGVDGRMSWAANFLGASSKIVEAAPGAALFIVGIFIVYVTRFRIKSKRFWSPIHLREVAHH
jgi:F0F1-type ATP synthase membrane subunit c/vacuolar-type H+-ATPase subunit K